MALLILLTAGPAAADTVQDKPLTGGDDPMDVLRIMEVTSAENDLREYRKVLADSFRYETDLNTLATHPRVDWEAWDIAAEEVFLAELLSVGRGWSLRLRDGVLKRGTHNRGQAVYEIRYELGPYQGEATFRFVETNDRWYLWQWLESVPVYHGKSHEPFLTSGDARAMLIR